MTEKKKKQVTLRKGSFVICKYDGDNGDLVVGAVQSVRKNGEIVCQNLLTFATSCKKRDVFLERNVLVEKQDADKVLEAYAKAFMDITQGRNLFPKDAAAARKKARKAARALAVEIAGAYAQPKQPPQGQQELDFSPPQERPLMEGEAPRLSYEMLERAYNAYDDLSADERRSFLMRATCVPWSCEVKKSGLTYKVIFTAGVQSFTIFSEEVDVGTHEHAKELATFMREMFIKALCNIGASAPHAISIAQTTNGESSHVQED